MDADLDTLAGALRERLLGNDSTEVAEVLRSLAAVRREEGRFEEALDLASRAVGIVESEAGADDPALVPYLLQLAQVHGASRADRERPDLRRRGGRPRGRARPRPPLAPAAGLRP